MAARAKSLTESAIPPTRGDFTDQVASARVFLNALERLGYDRPALLAAAGIDFSVGNDPDAVIPCQVIGGMFTHVMRTRPLQNLGSRLAMETPIGAFPLLDYLVLTCDTVASAVHQLARYFRLNEAPYELDIRESENPVRVIFHTNRDPMSLEFGVSLAVLHLREETDRRLRFEYVSFAHQPDDASEMERVFECSVRSGAEWSGFAVTPEAWRIPMRRGDPVLRSVLERHASEMLSRLPENGGRIGDLRRALMERLNQGDTEIRSVARSLATSARSLQRRLAAAGTSFQELLDSTRRDAAARYLEDRSLSVGEVAYLLGYSEPAAFHRAFKRWYSITPQEYRRKMPWR